MPLIAVWCFLLDGVFIGATKGKEMRNSMAVSAVAFFAIYGFMTHYGNHALWLAMLSFMALRGFTLGLPFILNGARGLFYRLAFPFKPPPIV